MPIGANASPFYRQLHAGIEALGGMFNAHLHLDRAGTLDEVYMESAGHRILEASYISLHEKHALISALHAGLSFAGTSVSTAPLRMLLARYVFQSAAVATWPATASRCTGA